MGREQLAPYYDDIYKTTNKWRDPWNMFPDRSKLWRAAADLVPKNSWVYDMGCGPGQFAQCMAEVNMPSAYIGVDFSSQAIGMAEEKMMGSPGFSFVCSDLLESTVWDEPEVCVCLEVLEHIEDDMGVLDTLSKGAQIVCSLPTFDSQGHVRWFTIPGAIEARYSQVLDFTATEWIKPVGNFWFLFRAIKR